MGCREHINCLAFISTEEGGTQVNEVMGSAVKAKLDAHVPAGDLIEERDVEHGHSRHLKPFFGDAAEPVDEVTRFGDLGVQHGGAGELEADGAGDEQRTSQRESCGRTAIEPAEERQEGDRGGDHNRNAYDEPGSFA